MTLTALFLIFISVAIGVIGSMGIGYLRSVAAKLGTEKLSTEKLSAEK